MSSMVIKGGQRKEEENQKEGRGSRSSGGSRR